MRASHLLVAACAGAVATGFGVAQSDLTFNQVSLCITTAIGPCGTLCEAFQCTPGFTMVSSNEAMRFDITSAPDTFYAVFSGIASGCTWIPGIQGKLSTWQPYMPIVFGRMEAAADPTLPCPASLAQFWVKLPALLPGYDLRFQVLGMDGIGHPEPLLAFSRAVEVRTR